MSAQSAYGKIILKEYIVTLRQSNKIVKKRISASSERDAKMGAEVYGRFISIIRAPKNLAYHIDKMYKPKLSVNERFQFFQTLSNFLKGYTLNDSLRIISENFKGAIKRVSNEIRSLPSADFPEHLEAVGNKDFPQIIIEVIKANSKINTLSDTLLEAVRFERKLIEIQKQDTTALIMSTLYLFSMMSTCIMLVMSYSWLDSANYWEIIPKEGPSRDTYNLLIYWSDIFYWISIIGITAYIGLVCLFIFMKSYFPALTDKIVSFIPVIRQVVLLRNSFLVTYQIGILVEKGIEIKTAFDQVLSGCVPGALKNDLERVLNLMKKGDPAWQRGFYSFTDLDRALLMSAGNSDEAALVFQSQASQFILSHQLGIKTLKLIQVVISGIFGLFLVSALTIIMFLPAAGGLEMI